METEQDLLAMELHDERVISKYVSVWRVYGGWIYEFKNSVTGETISTNFIPEVKLHRID